MLKDSDDRDSSASNEKTTTPGEHSPLDALLGRLRPNIDDLDSETQNRLRFYQHLYREGLLNEGESVDT